MTSFSCKPSPAAILKVKILLLTVYSEYFRLSLTLSPEPTVHFRIFVTAESHFQVPTPILVIYCSGTHYSETYQCTTTNIYFLTQFLRIRNLSPGLARGLWYKISHEVAVKMSARAGVISRLNSSWRAYRQKYVTTSRQHCLL